MMFRNFSLGREFTERASRVEFYGSYFPEPISQVNLSMIQEILVLIPAVILYTNITDTQINIHLGFWTPANSHTAFRGIDQRLKAA